MLAPFLPDAEQVLPLFLQALLWLMPVKRDIIFIVKRSLQPKGQRIIVEDILHILRICHGQGIPQTAYLTLSVQLMQRTTLGSGSEMRGICSTASQWNRERLTAKCYMT